MTKDIHRAEDADDLTEVTGADLLKPLEELEPTDDLMEALSQAGRITDVSVLDLARCRAELADAGLVVPGLNALANELAEGRELRSTTASVGAVTAVVTLAAAILLGVVWSGAEFIDLDFLDSVASGTTVVIATLAAMAAALGVWCVKVAEVSVSDLFTHQTTLPALTSHRRALGIVTECVSQEPLSWEGRPLLQRASAAASSIARSEVWSSEMFDTHRVRVDLVEEVRLVAERVRVLTSGTSGGNVTSAEMRKALIDSTTARLAALEQYRDQVLAVQRAADRLHRAELEEIGSDRMVDWLAKTGADEGQVAELNNMAAESRAAAEAIADTLAAMQPTAAILTHRRTDESAT